MGKKLEKIINHICPDQLLLTTFRSDDLVAASTQTFQFTAPTDRGKGLAIAPIYFRNALDSRLVTFTLQINGKSILEDARALDYLISAGSSKYVKIGCDIPEGAVITLTVVSGAIGDIDQEIHILVFYTKAFIPRNIKYDLIQTFTHAAIAVGRTEENFTINTQRGRVIGLGITFISPISNSDTGDQLNISINGVQIIQNVSPGVYAIDQEILYINNFLTNITQGAILNIDFTKIILVQTDIAVNVYFKEFN